MKPGSSDDFKRVLHRLHHWKNQHQYLGRYSIEKLHAFHEYQENTSIWRVLAVLVFVPIPVLAVLLSMEALELGKPGAGLSHNSVTLIRSILSHILMTFATLISIKTSIHARDDVYSQTRIALISVLVGVSLELVFLPLMIFWRFPVPMREFVGLVPFTVFVVGFHVALTKKLLVTYRKQLVLIMPLLGAQLTLFYGFLGLSIAFSYFPLGVQAVMVLTFPVVKIAMKKLLWRVASQLEDLSTDITICMVEISGALYQTVCLQHVESPVLGVLLMAMDFIQAVGEVNLYMANDYVVDHRTTLVTAVRIIDSALFPGTQAVEARRCSSSVAEVRRVSSSMVETVEKITPQRWCFPIGSSKVRVLPESSPSSKHIEAETDGAKRIKAVFEAQAFSVALSQQAIVVSDTQKQLLDLSLLSNALPTPSSPSKDGVATPILATSSPQIDGVMIERRDQARILEQSLQLLFSSEVLLFVEFMEVVMPVLYAVYVGVAWHLPNAKYNLILRGMSQKDVIEGVATSLVYAAMEAVSLALMCWLMERKYGVKPLYQLAFLLERYSKALQGKLLGSFITIINSATVHQGIDFTFRFQYGDY